MPRAGVKLDLSLEERRILRQAARILQRMLCLDNQFANKSEQPRERMFIYKMRRKLEDMGS